MDTKIYAFNYELETKNMFEWTLCTYVISQCIVRLHIFDTASVR